MMDGDRDPVMIMMVEDLDSAIMMLCTMLYGVGLTGPTSRCGNVASQIQSALQANPISTAGEFDLHCRRAAEQSDKACKMHIKAVGGSR